MPQHPLCNKCRQIPAVEGDTWCYGCAGWEAIGRELSGSWDGQGARRVANDLVVNAARQVRALRSLSAGLARESGPTGGAGETRAPKRAASEDRREERKSLPRRRSSGHAAPKEEQESEEEEDAAEETDEEDRRRRSKRSPEGPERSRGGHRRPPEPDRSPVPPGTTSIRASLSRADKRPADKREHHPPATPRPRDTSSGRPKTSTPQAAGRESSSRRAPPFECGLFETGYIRVWSTGLGSTGPLR